MRFSCNNKFFKILEAIHICKNYEHTKALNKLSFSIKPGEIFCLLGQNGAGKTITIHIFLGILKPTSGEAYINGEEVFNNKLIKSSIAYIPEVVKLYKDLAAIENLSFFSQLAGLYSYSIYFYSTKLLDGLL